VGVVHLDLRPQAWIERRRVFDHWTTPVIIPRWRVQDIDDEDDWTRAELMFTQVRGTQ
jgi:N-acylneuraminate cytidylyltransferase